MEILESIKKASNEESDNPFNRILSYRDELDWYVQKNRQNDEYIFHNPDEKIAVKYSLNSDHISISEITADEDILFTRIVTTDEKELPIRDFEEYINKLIVNKELEKPSYL